MTAAPQDPSLPQAQREVRTIYHGGFIGPLVSAVVWLAAGLTAQSAGVSTAATVLFLGGVLIFPVSLLGNRLLGERADLPAGHPLRGLAMQSAFGMVAGLVAAWLLAPLVPGGFFPLAMVIVGAHYFTFTHLYGDAAFLVAGIVQVVAGLLVMISQPTPSTGAFIMAGLLVAMSLVLFLRQRQRSRRLSP